MQTSTEVSVRFRSHLCIVAAMSLLLGVWGCWWGYPFRLHPDTHIVVEDAWRIATTGQTVVSGYMYGWLPRLLYAGAMAPLATVMPHEPPARDLYLDMEAPFWAYIVARTVNALLSTGLVVVVAMLGARLLGPQGGVLAALAVAVSFLRVRECHFASPDTPQTFFIWLSIYLTVRAFYGIGRLRDWAIAGCAAGAAAACRLPAGLVIVTPLFASLLAFSEIVYRTFCKKLSHGISNSVVQYAVKGECHDSQAVYEESVRCQSSAQPGCGFPADDGAGPGAGDDGRGDG